MARTKVPFTNGRDQTMKSLAAVAKDFKEFKPAPEVLRHIQAVPTIFPQYDSALRIGGHPIRRFTLVHGPSNEGKSSFVLGLGRSFLERDHFFAYADAEKTTPLDWVNTLLGPYATHPGFVAIPVKTYEQTVDGVRDFCMKVADHRKRGNIPPTTTGIVVVDSIRKLVPAGLFKNLAKGAAGEKGKGIDGFGGRAGQMKAALNAAWVDELIPLLDDTMMGMAVIARETVTPGATSFDEVIRTGGGSALFYEAAADIRIKRKYIRDETDKSQILGERHTLEICKTKVANKEASNPIAHFHVSNGKRSPRGFDRPRDLIEIGIDTGIIDLKGSWYSYDTGEQNGKLGQGADTAVAALHANPTLALDIELAIRDVCRGLQTNIEQGAS